MRCGRDYESLPGAMRVRPAFWSLGIQAAGSAATVGAALLVAATMGLGAQGRFGLLRSWNDALTSAAVLGLPQALLHLQYREQVPISALRAWVGRYVLALVVGVACVALLLVVVGAGIGSAASARLASAGSIGAALARLDATTLAVLAAAVPLSAAHLLARSLVLREVGVVPYALVTALPSLLIVAALLPICAAGARDALVWALFASALVSAGAAACLVRAAAQRQATPVDAPTRWSRRTLWHVGLETGGQNVLTAFTPALMLSTASLLGAPLTEIGLVSLGLQVYALFGVAAAYVAPQLYDRAARSARSLGARELALALRARVDARIAGAAASAAALALILALLFWPIAKASPVLLVAMALAGAVSMWSRLLITLMLARGAFRPLSVQAFARLLCACGLTALLMRAAGLSAEIALPLALLATELAMVVWLQRSMKQLPAGEALR